MRQHSQRKLSVSLAGTGKINSVSTELCSECLRPERESFRGKEAEREGQSIAILEELRLSGY